MDKRNLWNAALVCSSFLYWSETCVAQIPVEIIGVPPTADSIFVLADGDELRSPLEILAKVGIHSPLITIALPPAKPQLLRIRAVAFGGPNVFPVVTAIGTATFGIGQVAPARIIMAWPTPRVEMLNESTDGTVTFLVDFAAYDFFRVGDVIELWISGSTWSRNCAGIHFLAPLVKAGARWQALFVIPARLCAGTSIQLAYHALAFKVADQIPLFVWPNRDRNEPPLQIVSLNAVPADSHPALLNQKIPSTLAPEGSATSTPSSTTVMPGRDGRLIRVPLKTAPKKIPQ